SPSASTRWCSGCWPTWRPRSRRRVCSPGGRPGGRTRAARTGRRPRWPSSSPPRRRCASPPTPSRCTGATASSRSTRSSGISGTPRSRRSTRARPRSRSWSSPVVCSPASPRWPEEDRATMGADGKKQREEESYRPFVERTPERDVPYETLSGIPVRPLYTPEDLAGWRYEDKLGYPGEFPYTRGPYPSMYRGKLWTMRMFAGFGRPEDTNERFKYLLAQGQTGLSTAFDMPALMGYDADHPRARGEVGKEGVSISTLDDFERLFVDIPLGDVTTSMTINCTAS